MWNKFLPRSFHFSKKFGEINFYFTFNLFSHLIYENFLKIVHREEKKKVITRNKYSVPYSWYFAARFIIKIFFEKNWEREFFVSQLNIEWCRSKEEEKSIMIMSAVASANNQIFTVSENIPSPENPGPQRRCLFKVRKFFLIWNFHSIVNIKKEHALNVSLSHFFLMRDTAAWVNSKSSSMSRGKLNLF